jgi:hypothetical protein
VGSAADDLEWRYRIHILAARSDLQRELQRLYLPGTETWPLANCYLRGMEASTMTT